jgi:hypothetical protein
MTRLLSLAAASMLALSVGCGDDAEPAGPADAPEFIALPTDFAGYETWWNVAVGEGTVDGAHPGPARRVYVNVKPDRDAAEFPVGTVIVKVGAGGELTGTTGTEVHAMVKRGGTFNSQGAVGWEWFELKPTSSGTPSIVWRGTNAPSGHGYKCVSTSNDAGVIEIDCNDCHAAARSNDYLLGPALSLPDVGQ